MNSDKSEFNTEMTEVTNLPPPNLVPLKQAANLLGISINAVRIRIFRNSLPVKVYRKGGRQFCCFDEICAFNKNGGWTDKK